MKQLPNHNRNLIAVFMAVLIVLAVQFNLNINYTSNTSNNVAIETIEKSNAFDNADYETNCPPGCAHRQCQCTDFAQSSSEFFIPTRITLIAEIAGAEVKSPVKFSADMIERPPRV